MIQRTALLGLLYFFGCLSWAWGWEEFNLNGHDSSFQHAQTIDISLLHGYYPKQFAQDVQPNYWMTPEEAGHYIAGRSQTPPYFLFTYTTTTPTTTDMNDETHVLIAPAKNYFPDKKSPAYPAVNHPARINDSLEIPQIIKEHAWMTSFNL